MACRLLTSFVLLSALAIAGCGGAGASTAGSDPSEPVDTAMRTDAQAQDPAEASAALCATMREDIGSIPSPKGQGDQAAYDSQVSAIEEEYLNQMGMLAVTDTAKLDEFIAAQQELFEAMAEARSAANPEESGEEGGGAAAEAIATIEDLAKDLDIEACASIYRLRGLSPPG